MWKQLLPLTKGITMNIRWILDFDTDIDSITAIDTKSSEEYWTLNDFTWRLKEKSITCLVAEDNGTIVGFIVYELFLHRFSLLRIGILPAYRKKGIGSSLIKELIGKLTEKRRLISAEVRERNLPIQLFLSSQGFKAIEILRDYYPDTGEDSFVFHYRTT
jgi:ribosomal-protein-alanine N-acetyltransferase